MYSFIENLTEIDSSDEDEPFSLSSSLTADGSHTVAAVTGPLNSLLGHRHLTNCLVLLIFQPLTAAVHSSSTSALAADSAGIFSVGSADALSVDALSANALTAGPNDVLSVLQRTRSRQARWTLSRQAQRAYFRRARRAREGKTSC